MLPLKYRLTKDKDFRNVRENGKHTYTQFFVLTWTPNNLDHPRFGMIASKKVGNAVQRHRAARILRESIRHNLDAIKPGFDFVIIARAGIHKHKQPVVEKELLPLLKKHHLLQ